MTARVIQIPVIRRRVSPAPQHDNQMMRACVHCRIPFRVTAAGESICKLCRSWIEAGAAIARAARLLREAGQ